MNQASAPSHALHQTWDTYTAAWKASTDAEKQDLFAQSLAPDCEYNDQGKQVAVTGFFATA